MQTIPLITDCILRPIVQEDAQQLMAIKNNREAAQWLEKDNSGYSIADIHAWINFHTNTSANLILGIEDTTKHLLIGYAGLYDIDPVLGACTFGILIGLPEYWNKGIGKAAAIAMTDMAFHTPGIHTIKLHVLNEHTHAIHLYMNIGFERVGLLKDYTKKNGKSKDVLVMEKRHYGINDHLV